MKSLNVLKSPGEAVAKKKKEKPELMIPQDTLDLETSLVTAMNELSEGGNVLKWKQSTGFAPSNTSNCARFHYYRFTGYEQLSNYSAQTLRIFELGNKVEDIVGDLFEKMGILLESQVEIRLEDPPINGFIDFIIEWDGPKVVECKSINEAGFMFRRQAHKPTDSHYRQIQWYLRAMDQEEGFVFYFSKNTSEVLPILVKRNDVFLDKLSDKYRKIYGAYEAGIKPERPYKPESPTCAKCDARIYCWNDSEVGVKIS